MKLQIFLSLVYCIHECNGNSIFASDYQKINYMTSRIKEEFQREIAAIKISLVKGFQEDLLKLKEEMQNSFQQELIDFKETLLSAFEKDIKEIKLLFKDCKRTNYSGKQFDGKLSDEMKHFQSEMENKKNYVSTDKSISNKAVHPRMLVEQTENQEKSRIIKRLNVLETRAPIQPIAFSASRTPDTTIAKEQTVIYNAVHTNIGNAYHPTYGHFTAPVRGIYVFSAHIMCLNEGDDYITMVKNNVYGLMALYCYETHATDSNTVVTQLEIGDVVFLKAQFLPSGLRDGYNTFSGFLLQRIES